MSGIRAVPPKVGHPFAHVAAGAGGSNQQVSLRLDFLPSGEYCGYYSAKEAGLWAKNGLDVEIRSGTGSLESCKLVALGREDFAIADASTMMKSRIDGMPLKMIGTHLARPPISIFAKASKEIKSPKDLAGKSVAMASVSAGRSLLPPFVKLNGVDPAKVELSFMAPGALMAAFLEDKVDALVSYLVPWKALLESRGFDEGKNLVILRWMDYGFHNLAGAGFIVSEERRWPNAVTWWRGSSLRSTRASARQWNGRRRQSATCSSTSRSGVVKWTSISARFP
jgi:NitT/TauT family transport system substrate-binding protein